MTPLNPINLQNVHNLFLQAITPVIPNGFYDFFRAIRLPVNGEVTQITPSPGVIADADPDRFRDNLAQIGNTNTVNNCDKAG
jgi:hypothetical protein